MSHRAVCLPTTTIMILAIALAGVGCGQVADRRTAAQLVGELVAEVGTASPTTVYDATTDPNRLLGRPRGYASKASFADQRVRPVTFVPDDPGTVEPGGSVEIFTSREAAAARRARLQANAARNPAEAEYDFLIGSTLLRVSRMLSAEQAAEYRSALERLAS